MLSRLMVGIGTAIPSLLTSGNSKLGKINIWSIPAVATCPGSSGLCRSRCYAVKGYYTYLNVVTKLFKNLLMCASPFFVAWMIASVKARRNKIVRIHAAGDFFSVPYIRSWLFIIRACPETQFFVYSRSWRDPEMRELLALLSHQPNVQVWYSCDAETDVPTLRPDENNVRTAYMAISLDDVALRPVDLIFRDYPTRGVVQKHVCGDLVCPAENGTNSHVTCNRCQLCFSDPVRQPNKRTTQRFAGAWDRPSRRIPLQLALN